MFNGKLESFNASRRYFTLNVTYFQFITYEPRYSDIVYMYHRSLCFILVVFIFSYMACVKYLPIFTMAHHYEHRPIFNTGHIGENENYTFYGNKVCIFSYNKVGLY